MSSSRYTARQLGDAAQALARDLLGCDPRDKRDDFYTCSVKLNRVGRDGKDTPIVESITVGIDALFNYLDRLHGFERREKPPTPPSHDDTGSHATEPTV